MENNTVYVVAVSGGVDSIVLLHKLVSKLEITGHPPLYIVAHFDHGIRQDSQDDAEFVAELANKYNLDFELGEGKLGPDASEATAREARYRFLRKVKHKHSAQMIITAHHQDDLLETMIINIIRGTGPRGLSPMNGQSDILRPLINRRKSELIKYANDNNLTWQEDSTNTDEKYLRNYVRTNIMPKLEPELETFLEINRHIEKLYYDIDSRISNLLPKQNILYRNTFLGYPYIVQKEIIRNWLIRCGVADIDSSLIERITVSVKTLPTGKKIDINGRLWLNSEKQNVLITSKTSKKDDITNV